MTVSDDFDQDGALIGARSEFDPRRYLKILRRRYPFLILPAIVIFAGFYWYSRILPPVYQSSATILVESQLIPTDLARPTVSANASERIQLIEQRLMTRDNLLQIARTYDLFSKDALSPSEIVDRIRRASSIDQIDVANRAQPNMQAIGFTVSFKYEDPSIAAKVANDYVTAILQQNIQSRTTSAMETSKFFDAQVASLEHDLAAKEADIIAFKGKNQDSLPETLGSRQSLLTQLQGRIDDIAGRIAVLETQKQMWQQHGDAAIDPASNSVEAQLNQLRMQLIQLRAVYSDNHPDVRAVQARINALEKASAGGADTGAAPVGAKTAAAPADAKTAATPAGAEVAAAPAGGEAAFPPAGAGTAVASAGAKAGADASVPSDATSLRIADIDRQIEALKSQQADLQKQADALDVSIQKTPQVEIALNVLMRDYNGLQQQYAAAKAKKSEATTGQLLEQDRQAERFEVIEQATVPSKPISPDRTRIASTGAFGGIVAGIGLLMLLEYLDKSIRESSDLQRRLRIRPIASIPYLTLGAEVRRRRRLWGTALAGGTVAVALFLVSVQMFYMPLDLFVAKVMQRLGL